MKILKLYSVLAILILSLTFTMWIVGFYTLEEALDTLKQAGAVLGLLFLSTFIIQGIVKPISKDKKK